MSWSVYVLQKGRSTKRDGDSPLCDYMQVVEAGAVSWHEQEFL